MQRACALAFLSGQQVELINPGKSNDDLAALDIIQKLGAVVESGNDSIIISPNKNPQPANEINCGESGLGIRMFTPIASLFNREIGITGSGSLLQRPIDFFDEVLPQFGVRVQSNKGHLPLKIQGPLSPVSVTVDGSLSSQFLTGLLIAFGYAAEEPVTIKVTNLKSKPYIDLTLQMMEQFGYRVEQHNYENFVVHPRKPGAAPNKYIVEADWSSASFLLVAGAIAGPIEVTGLNLFSTQADKAVLQALMAAGINMSVEENRIQINKSMAGAGKAFQFNATDCPDLFPPLVALAAYCRGTSVVEGVHRLTHKESNRALTLLEEFGKLGVSIKLQDDLMIIEGGNGLQGAAVHSHHDHRIAMACAVAALQANGETVIQDAGAVQKSYPDFFNDLNMLHAAVSLSTNA